MGHVTPHSLRRTFISLLAARADLPYVMAQAGHSDPKVTLSIYAKVISTNTDFGAAFDGLAPAGERIGLDEDRPSAIHRLTTWKILSAQAQYRVASSCKSPIRRDTGKRMGHRATIYSVRVHKRNRPNEFVAFGALNDEARYLGDFFLDVLEPGNFACVDPKGEREVTCETRKLAGEDNADLQAIFFSGERGVRAKIMKQDGQLAWDQMPTDTQMLRCGSVIRLPRVETVGWWSCHMNKTRGVKSLVAPELIVQFRKEFPELILKIEPVVNKAALQAALEEGSLLSATLTKYEKPSDIAANDKWSADDTGLKLDLSIKPERGKLLPSSLALRAFEKEDAALGNVVEFRGLPFDSASFEVELANGIKRSYNTARPDGGHPFSHYIEPELEQDGDPKDASLFTELGKVITELG